MKKLLIILQLLIIASCKEKKTFNIPNDYYPNYKSGDTLIFKTDSGDERSILCYSFKHYFEIKNSENKEYTYEYYVGYFKPISGNINSSLTIEWNGLKYIIPPGFSDSTQFVLNWTGLNPGKIHSETILGNRYDRVVKVDCNCPNPDRHYIKTDLKKGLLTFFDSTGTLWQFKEKRPKL